MGCIQSTILHEAEGFSPMLRWSPCGIISCVARDAARQHSLSFNSFSAAAFALVDVNRDAFENISQLKDEISSNPDIVHFIREYLKSIMDTLHFFTAVKDSLQKARKAELLVREAVVLFEDGHNPRAALEKLREFKERGNPFTEKFIKEFMLVAGRQKSIVSDLLRRKQGLDGTLRSVKAWRKVWNIVYSASFASVLICAVVLAAVAAPSAISGAFEAASGSMAPLQQWVDSIWDQFQSSHEEERDVIESLREGTEFAIQELNSIKDLVKEFEIKIRSRNENANLDIEEEEEAALNVVMLKMKEMARSFAENVEYLETEVDRCSTELMTATAAILETVTD